MAINTYFKNIADAIRTKTGSAGVITPAEMPHAILDIPAGGGSGIDTSNVNFIGFIIKQTRRNQTYIQACNIRFLDTFDNIIALPTSGNTYGVYGGTAITSNTEGPDKIWQSDALTQHLKTIISCQSYQNFYMFYMKNSSGIDLSSAAKWQWYTAEDEANRDPVTFGIVLANGTETDGLLKVCDYAINQSITTSRNALAYEGIING